MRGIYHLSLQNLLVHCLHMLEYFLPEDIHQILSEMDRVVDDNGTLVIKTPLMWDGFYSDLTHI